MIFVRTRVYVAGPITLGDVEHNIQQAIAAGTVLLSRGYAPFVPHLDMYMDPTGLAGTPRYEEALEMDFSYISVCHALLRLPGESKGADREVAWATKLGIPVYARLHTLLDTLPKLSPLTLAWKS